MVRTTDLLEDEEAHYSSSPTDCRRVDQKVNATRSKHSETEQRRRSKINERFQILRDLIPENEQKRDKASFLLEVIQYIQFLQEKLHMYEGSCQGWSSEPSKLLPWKINSGGPVESFVDQSHLDRNSLGPEDNAILNPSLLNNAHNPVDADLTGATLYKYTDDQQIISTNTLPLNMHVFEDLSSEHHDGPLHGSEHITRESHSHDLLMRARQQNCSVPDYPVNGEELINDSGEANVSNNCSQRLLNSLVKALQSSGVDLSQASISVQLDIGKQADDDHGNVSGLGYIPATNANEEYRHPPKKLRSDQS